MNFMEGRVDMVSDAEISNSAVKHGITLMGVNPATFHESRDAFAREMYELGRKHQRESDAVVCDEIQKKSYLTLAKQCAGAIRDNTGDPKCQNPK